MNKFRNSDSAVSPVIGVILMVAITVVLAAVVFILVVNLSDNVPNGPTTLSVTRNGDNSFSILSVDGPVSYTNLTIKDNGIDQSYTVNGASPSGNMEAADLIRVSGLVAGSHRIQFVYQGEIIYSSEFTV